MKEALSNRINSLPASATLAMAAKARELKNQGVNVIGLSLGEPDFNTPDFIKEAAVQAVNDNYNSYTPVDGYGELKEAICKKSNRGVNWSKTVYCKRHSGVDQPRRRCFACGTILGELFCNSRARRRKPNRDLLRYQNRF